MFTTSIKQTIHKESYDSNFTVFSNDRLQNRIKGDVNPSATEIHHYLVSLPKNWQITTTNVAKIYGVSKKYIQKLFKILIKNDLMRQTHLRRNGKFSGISYDVYQEPQVVSRPPVKSAPKPLRDKAKTTVSPEVVSQPPATYYIKKTYKKAVAQPAAALDTKILTILRDNKIRLEKNMIKQGVNKFGVDYMCELIRYAYRKNPQNPGALVRKNIQDDIHWDSIRVKVNEYKTAIAKEKAAKERIERLKADNIAAKKYFEEPPEIEPDQATKQFLEKTSEEQKAIKIKYCRHREWNAKRCNKFMKLDNEMATKRYSFIGFLNDEDKIRKAQR